MKRLVGKIERVVRDRWFKYLIVIGAYLLLFTVLLNLSERGYAASSALFLFSILLLIARVVFLITTKSSRAEPLKTKVNPLAIIIRNTLIKIGYLALLAVIFGGDYKLLWIIYGLMLLTVCISIVTLLFVLKKRQPPEEEHSARESGVSTQKRDPDSPTP